MGRLAWVATATAVASAPGGTLALALRGPGRARARAAGPDHRAQMPTNTSTSNPAARRSHRPRAMLAAYRRLHARRRVRRQEEQHAVEALLRERALGTLLLAPEEKAAHGGAEIAPIIPARGGEYVCAQLPEAAPRADLCS